MLEGIRCEHDAAKAFVAGRSRLPLLYVSRNTVQKQDTWNSSISLNITIMDSNHDDLVAQFSGITGALPATVSLERTLPHIRHQSSIHLPYLSVLPPSTPTHLTTRQERNRTHCIRLEPRASRHSLLCISRRSCRRQRRLSRRRRSRSIPAFNNPCRKPDTISQPSSTYQHGSHFP
jgi:hypothetical protein